MRLALDRLELGAHLDRRLLRDRHVQRDVIEGASAAGATARAAGVFDGLRDAMQVGVVRIDLLLEVSFLVGRVSSPPSATTSGAAAGRRRAPVAAATSAPTAGRMTVRRARQTAR